MPRPLQIINDNQLSGALLLVGTVGSPKPSQFTVSGGSIIVNGTRTFHAAYRIFWCARYFILIDLCCFVRDRPSCCTLLPLQCLLSPEFHKDTIEKIKITHCFFLGINIMYLILLYKFIMFQVSQIKVYIMTLVAIFKLCLLSLEQKDW